MRIFLLAIIISVAAILRFWDLGGIPVSLSHDEVAIGYNGWSILQTGKDEYGASFPMLFRSFEDYKLPGYIYSVAVSEFFFGLSPFAVRLPSAVFGVLTVVLFFLLLREVMKYADKSSLNFKIYLPYVSSFLLAINPWHINFSRAAFESNVSLFFIVACVYFLFTSLRRRYFIFFALLSAVLSVYFYYTTRIILPLIILTFFVLYKKDMFLIKKNVILAIIIGFVFLLPILPAMFSTGLARVNQVSIFEDKSLTNPYSEARLRNDNSFLSAIMYNRRFAYFQQFLDNYLKNFAPDFYFVNGTGPLGLLYIWELPFFVLGILFILKLPYLWKWIFVIWFVGVPIIGGLTLGQPNALRTLPNSIVSTLFSGYGILFLIQYFKKNKYWYVIISGLVCISVFFFIRFIYLYFDYQANLSALHWKDGHAQMVNYLINKENKYSKVYVTGEYWRPYIYYLFYSGYSPLQYQKNGNKYKIDNIYFGKADWDREEGRDFSSDYLSDYGDGNILYILSEKDLISQTKLVTNEKRKYDIKVLNKIDGRIARNVFFAVEIK